MNLVQALFALSAARGPSGREWETGGTSVLDTARELLKPLVDEAWTDPHGSLIGVKKNPGAPRVLLDAHLDEVCLFVTGQKEGFLTFLGRGTDTRLLPDTVVKVLTPAGELTGVITCLPPHVLTQAEKDAPFALEDLFIDCGLTEQEAGEFIGCPVVYDTEPFLLAEHRLCGKSLDDRTCYAMFLRTLELVRDKDLAARYGGEEFTLLLSGENGRNACRVAERIRKSVESYPFEYQGQKISVTISGGVAEFSNEINSALSPEELVNIADKALYVSKNKGRNRITFAYPALLAAMAGECE